MMSLKQGALRKSAQKGFTLIEVLIASAIAIAAMGLLLQLFSSGLDRLNRISLNAHLIIAEKEIINRLHTLNPALVSQGKGIVEGLEYVWTSEIIEAYREMSPTVGNPDFPRYVALYEISIDLSERDGDISQLKITRLGWKDTL